MMRKRLFFVLTLFAVCSLAFGQKKFSKITAADFATPSEAADSSVDAVYIYDIGETLRYLFLHMPEIDSRCTYLLKKILESPALISDTHDHAVQGA